MLTQNIPARLWIVGAFALLTVLGIWPALTNGQPFFYADTTAYIRGADLSISKVFGEHFATDWAKDQRRTIDAPTANSKDQHAVLAGRSIVYGVLLYLGEISGGKWLSIVVQSLIATYLVFLFVIRTLGLPFRAFLVCCVVLCITSPLPFFSSYLMPDVFAGFLILGFAILALGWERLKRFERAAVSAVLLFAVLAHLSHLILLVALTALTVGYLGFAERSWRKAIRPFVHIAAVCIVVAVLWEAAFSFAVSRAVGSPPIRPPFIMAKLVSMLGQPAVARVCESNRFTVCSFADRFPIDDETFLWSFDQHAGVFNVADTPTKRLLSDEQIRFAFSIIPPNAGAFIVGISLDTVRQLAHISLDEYAYSPVGLQFYKERMPSREFAGMRESLAARADVYKVFGRAFLGPIAALSAVLTVLFLGVADFRADADTDAMQLARTWSSATWVFLAGVVLNAIICGGLSDVNNRYEARVIWLVQLSCITGVFALEPHRKALSFWRRRFPKFSSAYSSREYDRHSEIESR